jgi:hypothetical protein
VCENAAGYPLTFTLHACAVDLTLVRVGLQSISAASRTATRVINSFLLLSLGSSTVARTFYILCASFPPAAAIDVHDRKKAGTRAELLEA